MKNEQGFSLVELLIVVAIIAIIAAIAVPSLLTARQAANETGAIQGCRTVGSAEIAFSATNNQQYETVPNLITAGFLDTRFTQGINGYQYADGAVAVDAQTNGGNSWVVAPGGSFAILATPNTGLGRFIYGIGPDQVVRYQGTGGGYGGADPAGVTPGMGIGVVAGS